MCSHKLIIASSYSTSLQISATLHKLLPIHPTGHMLRVQIFDVGETNASSYQQLTVYGANHIHVHVQYLRDMQTLMYMHKLYHVHNYTHLELAPKELECSIQKDACYSCRLLGSDLFSNVNKLYWNTLVDSKHYLCSQAIWQFFFSYAWN